MKVFLFFIPFLAMATCNSDYLSFGAGAFDILRDKHRTFEAEVECKFRSVASPIDILHIRPLLGLMATAKGAFYIYGGVNFDLIFCNSFIIAPGFAAGYYNHGSGKNLGFPLEFRSGVECAWQFCDLTRLGIHFYHISNASIGHKNPGEESLVLFYDIPLVKGFPFGTEE